MGPRAPKWQNQKGTETYSHVALLLIFSIVSSTTEVSAQMRRGQVKWWTSWSLDASKVMIYVWPISLSFLFQSYRDISWEAWWHFSVVFDLKRQWCKECTVLVQKIFQLIVQKKKKNWTRLMGKTRRLIWAGESSYACMLATEWSGLNQSENTNWCFKLIL